MELIILRSSAILELKVCCLIIQFPFEAGFERSTGQRVARLLAYAEGTKYHERKWSECYFMWYLYQPVQTRNKNKSSKVIVNNCCPNTKIRNISPSLHIVSFIGARMKAPQKVVSYANLQFGHYSDWILSPRRQHYYCYYFNSDSPTSNAMKMPFSYSSRFINRFKSDHSNHTRSISRIVLGFIYM